MIDGAAEAAMTNDWVLLFGFVFLSIGQSLPVAWRYVCTAWCVYLLFLC